MDIRECDFTHLQYIYTSNSCWKMVANSNLYASRLFLLFIPVDARDKLLEFKSLAFNGRTLLHELILCLHKEQFLSSCASIFFYLLSCSNAQVAVNLVDNDGRTPLHLLVCLGVSSGDGEKQSGRCFLPPCSYQDAYQS